MKENNIPGQKEKSRLVIVGIGLFFLFSLLIAQFYQTQIIEGEKWTKTAEKQHFFIVKEPFQRGRFLSNTSIKKGHQELPQSFVFDIEKFNLYIDPLSIPEELKKIMIEQLSKTLNLSPEEKIVFSNQFKKKSRSRKIAPWLDPETKEAILKWWEPFAKKSNIARNALFFISDYQRSYPFGKLLGQVLHTIQIQKDDLTQQAYPTGGLELSCDKFLQGRLGKRRLKRSPRHSFETGDVLIAPENGKDIHLSINHCLQAIAEEEIAKGVKKCKAKSGWAVMMNPYSGEILALAQYPFFYPPDYQHYFNDLNLIEQTKIKAITDANEPGSVMKPFTLICALIANDVLKSQGKNPIFSPEAKMETSNPHFKGRSKPLVDTHLHSFLNMNLALQRSSNIYMARLSESIVNTLGKDWYRNQLFNLFGFGKKTGIQLPGESNGVLPSTTKSHANKTPEWSISTPYSLAMGHNIQTTSLQLVRAYAILANGGFLVEPTLIRKVVKKTNDQEEVILDLTSKERIKKFPRVIKKEITDKVVTALKYVTKPGGTSRKGDVWGYSEAGKSSTAKKIVNGQYSETKYVASFIGFAPADKPAFVLLVTMDEPEYGYIPGVGKNHNGGTCAGPVFREIASRSLTYLGIPLDDPYGFPREDPRYNADKAHWMPETKKLQELYDSWNNHTQKGK